MQIRCRLPIAMLICGLAASSLRAATQTQLEIFENDGFADGAGYFSWNEPLNPNGTIWFDILIRDGLGQSAEGIQVSLSVVAAGHPGSLEFHSANSQNISSDPAYWVWGNSSGASASDLGGGGYRFSDEANNPQSVFLMDETIVARFAFVWDGTPGNYLVSIHTSTANTFVVQNSAQQAPSWTTNQSLLLVPEPVAVGFFAIGALLLGRRKK